MLLLKAKELNLLGYTCHQQMDVVSTDRGEDDLLSELGLDSINDLTVEHPKAKDAINRLSKHLTDKEIFDLPNNGKWMVFSTHNDIGWTFVCIGYFTFEEKEELTTCKIKIDDDSTTTAFLKEVSAPTLADFKYYNADGSVFDGTVVSSDTNIRFLLSRIEKGIR